MRGAGGAGRGTGAGGRNAGQGGRTAKDWQILQEQEDRLAMVKERRDHLMDLDRKKNQEAFLTKGRTAAADAQSRSEDVH